ncbi:unnamed protein product [Trichobilharzia szidati]|nr:unnamed protein product [Trichobilharzia szidati]
MVDENGYYMSNKSHKKEPINSPRLQILIDKVTTCGSNKPEDALFGEIINLCCESTAAVSDFFRLATVQLMRKHAQIRLGVLRLLRILSSPQEIVKKMAVSIDRASEFIPLSNRLRNLILDNLQDIYSNMVQLDSDSPSLPPPKEAAEQLQIEALELILDWEYELHHGYYDISPWNHPVDTSSCLQWIPSQRGRGQLNAFLNYLNLDPRSIHHMTSCEYLSTRERIEKIKKKRDQKVRLFNSEKVKSQRLLIKCLKEIEDDKELIEENLTALSNLLDILVPNPSSSTSTTDEMNHQKSETETTESNQLTTEFNNKSSEVTSEKVNPMDALRLHGCLLGSSSGYGLGSTLNIEIHIPYNFQTDSTHISSGLKVHVKRSKEIRDVEDSAKQYAHLAKEKYKPKLINWLLSMESGIQLISLPKNLLKKRSEKIEQIKQWINRLETLTSLFYDRIEFINEAGDEDVDEGNTDKKLTGQLYNLRRPDDAVASTDDEDSDFEDVDNTFHQSVEPAVSVDSSSCQEFDSINSSKHEVLTPNETDNSKLKNTTEQLVDNHHHRHSTTISTYSQDEYISTDNIIIDDYSTVVIPQRTIECEHRFWKPIVSDDNDNQHKEYLESAISWNSTSDIPQCDTSLPCNDDSLKVEISSNSSPVEDKKPDVVSNHLVCWAPLLSGSLCQRRDRNGRCPAHGKIVKRDRLTGRPISIEDRKLLQEEMASIRMARQKELDEKKKKDSRKHYPGLINVSKKVTSSRERLKARVMKKFQKH